jgi:multidrug efflux pump subunit AcrB
MSITGIIIALGLLIDNAIIVVDEVQNRLRDGAETAAAVGGTVQHLRIPLLASTLTTVLAFVPIAVSPGSVGEFIGTIGLTVILALLSSLFISLTVIAALAGRLRHWQPFPFQAHWWQQGLAITTLSAVYHRSLQWLFHRPWRTISLCLILPIIGFVVFPTLEQQFFPPTNRDQFQIELQGQTQGRSPRPSRWCWRPAIASASIPAWRTCIGSWAKVPPAFFTTSSAPRRMPPTTPRASCNWGIRRICGAPSATCNGI